MRETETSAPSLRDWAMVPREATKAMSDAGWAASEAADKDWKSCTPRQLWTAMLAAAPPTAMAEAVASARAEGVKEGLERAAQNCEMRASVWRHHVGKPSETPCDAQIAGVFDTAAQAIRGLPAPPTLIPGGSSDAPDGRGPDKPLDTLSNNSDSPDAPDER